MSTLTIELSSEEMARLESQAKAQGVGTVEYAQRLFRQLIEADPDEAWEADMRALSEGSENLPVLSLEDTSRESIYGARG